ncbi:MAG: CarD family transcriptional regulator [Tissierellia bacterium]|nr:CarD family transcriptional regulator [Tissierellia bacterium]
MYEVGDRIVYPVHGVGVIVDIEYKQILGETREYYVLKLPVNDMQVLVPVGQMEEIGIREIKSKEEIDEIVGIFKDPNLVKMPKNWNRRFRFNQEEIKSGDLARIAEVIKNLEHLDSQKSLSTGERKMLNNAREIILSEMVFVYDKSLEEVTAIMDQAIRESGLLDEKEGS